MSNSIPVLDTTGKTVGEYQVNEAWLERERGAQALHELVTAILANKRAGTACTKTRGNVSGGGKKPWKQKGTGRARSGSTRSPVWRGGGTTFGPLPRKYTTKVNKKVRQLAIRRAFTECLDGQKLLLVNDLAVGEAKSSQLRGVLQQLGCERTTLVVMPAGGDSAVKTAGRNMPGVTVASAATVNVYQLLRHHKILLSQAALEALGQRLA
jgi:large subunit ribosomal protein L4